MLRKGASFTGTLVVSARLLALILLLTPLAVSACSHKPSATELFQLQNQCAAASKQYFESELRDGGNPPDFEVMRDDYTSHYSVTRQKCYVEDSEETRTRIRDLSGAVSEVVAHHNYLVSDVFERKPVLEFQDRTASQPKPSLSRADRERGFWAFFPTISTSTTTKSCIVFAFADVNACAGGDTLAAYAEARKPYMEQ